MPARRLLPVLGALLFAISAWVLARTLNQIGFATLQSSLAAVPVAQILGAIALTILNYVVLTFHDQLAFAYVGATTVAPRQIAFASFVGYAFSNNVGFAVVSGASARYRFYSRLGVSGADLSRIVAFYSATFWVGLLLVGGASLVFTPPAGLSNVLSRPATLSLGVSALAVVIGYVAMCVLRRRPVAIAGVVISLPRIRLLIGQLLVSTCDWVLAASVLYALLPPAARPSLLLITGAFAVAQLTALASHVPGGLGVFEGLMFLFLAPDVPAATLAPALLLYRVIYYLLPLAIALVLLLADEAAQRRRQLSRWGDACHAVTTWAAPRILAAFTFACGALLLFSGVTPGVPERLAWLERVMPLPLLEASHFVASLTGLALLLLAQAIARRIDAAFYVTSCALAAGAVTSLMKGGDYEEATVLTLVLLALVAARRHFTRHARVFEQPLSLSWLTGVGTVVTASIWLGFFAYRHVAYSHDLWWQFAVQADAPRFLRASVVVAVGALVIAARQLLRPVLPARAAIDDSTSADIDRAIALQSRTMPNLVHVGDKSLLWNDQRTAFLMYGVRGRSCVALGDPVGPADAARDLIARFLHMCHESALTPVFYEATTDRLSSYADYGLAAIKIGEEATVPLRTFSLQGSTFKPLRTALNRIEREGFTFRVVDPSDTDVLMEELRDVSDEWLSRKGAAEKRFSLGSFSEAYLRRFPIAILERNGHIEAFANLWIGPDRVEIAPDLIRYRATAPPGVMDALFASMMLWAREQGFERFNLGMAPLSGLSASPLRRPWMRLGAFIYRHGEAFYNFQGVRAYKDKFRPTWQPRYLVYPGGLSLARVITDITALIAGGYQRVFPRPVRLRALARLTSRGVAADRLTEAGSRAA